MSNPSPNSVNASLLLRSSSAHPSRDRHDLTASAPTQATSIASSLFSESQGGRAAEPALAASPAELQSFNKRTSSLSNQQTFEESPAHTPRVFASSYGKPDHLEDVATTLELSATLLSHTTERGLLYKTHTSPPIISDTALSESRRHTPIAESSSSNASVNSTSTNDYNTRPSEGRRIDGISFTSKQSALGSPHYPGHISPTPQTQYTFRPSATWTSLGEGRDKRALEPMDGPNAPQDGKKSLERGRSVGGQDFADQQIEATLANEDSVTNARSRKASYFLGLFKENATSLDQKKSKDRVREASKLRSQTKDTSELHGRPDSRVQGSETAAQDPAAGYFNIESLPTGKSEVEYQDVYYSPTPRSHSRLRIPSRSASSTSVQPQTYAEGVAVDLLREKDSIEWRSGSPSPGALPFRLLEDIRNHHGHTTPTKNRSEPQIFPDTSDLSGRSVDVDSHLQKDDTSFTSQSDEDTREEQLRADQGTEEEYEYESDKEHISSATYYPHQAPSPEILAQSRDDLLKAFEGVSEGEILRSPRSTTPNKFDDEVHKDSDKDSLVTQSKRPAPQIHTDQTRSGPSSDYEDTTSKAAWSTGSSASDTDYESWDEATRSEREETGVTDDGGDRTPTATPHGHGHFLRNKVRREPLGAVELKPYKHQVGGHTKVFSFSKQAICKQLNNRENEFYEVIERRHPELLKFMPKYLGVLNVTYQKAPRRKKRKESSLFSPRINAAASSAKGSTEEVLNIERSMSKATLASPPLRVVSNSQHFEAQDDTIPRVVYANNLHIIPNNLFQRPSQLHEDTLRKSDGTSSKLAMMGNSLDDKTLHNEDKSLAIRNKILERPAPPKQHPSWGATTVNTRLKEKVLREVFSPPPIHQHQQSRNRRGHGKFGSLRGERSLRGEHLNPSRSNSKLNGSENGERVANDSTASSRDLSDQSPSLAETKRDFLSGSAPYHPLTEASLALLEKVHTISSGTQSNPSVTSDPKRIHRRRSANGLRRRQFDVNSDKRTDLAYYDDDGYGGDKEDEIFALELGALSQLPFKSPYPKLRESNTPKTEDMSLSVPELRKSLSMRNGYHEETRQLSNTESRVPAQIPTPVNPLQAQIHPDERVRHFLLLEDLTANMENPCVLDLKMGTRQYGIEDTNKKQNSQRQKCKITTSQQLGVRLCGMQVWNTVTEEYTFEDKYAGRDLKPGPQFQDALKRFLYDGQSYLSILRHIPILLEKISKLEKIIIKLPGYRFYASSLLMLYDGATAIEPAQDVTNAVSDGCSKKIEKLPKSNIDIKLIDFANCVTGEDRLPDGIPCPPADPNGVDRGYIRGLRSLKIYLQRIWKEVNDAGDISQSWDIGSVHSEWGIGKEADANWKWEDSHDDDLGEVST